MRAVFANIPYQCYIIQWKGKISWKNRQTACKVGNGEISRINTERYGKLLLPSDLYRDLKSFQRVKNLLSRAEQQASVQVRTVPYKSVLVANGSILRIGTAGNFLKRRIQRKGEMFLQNSGFAERMHNMHDQKRKI